MRTQAQQQSSKWQAGFTVIELVVVIVIIGILLALVFTAHASVAQSQRNTERQRDIDELHDEVEAYYIETNKYPTLSDINSTTWRSTNMKGVDTEVFRDPLGSSYNLVAKATPDEYAYSVSSATGSACDDDKTTCTQYALTATLEGGGTYVKNNIN